MESTNLVKGTKIINNNNMNDINNSIELTNYPKVKSEAGIGKYGDLQRSYAKQADDINTDQGFYGVMMNSIGNCIGFLGREAFSTFIYILLLQLLFYYCI